MNHQHLKKETPAWEPKQRSAEIQFDSAALSLASTGAITVNEARALVGQPPIPKVYGTTKIAADRSLNYWVGQGEPKLVTIGAITPGEAQRVPVLGTRFRMLEFLNESGELCWRLERAKGLKWEGISAGRCLKNYSRHKHVVWELDL